MIVKMIQNLENKMELQIHSLETRTEKMQEMLNKDLEGIKKSQSIMNNAIAEIKSTLEGTNIFSTLLASRDLSYPHGLEYDEWKDAFCVSEQMCGTRRVSKLWLLDGTGVTTCFCITCELRAILHFQVVEKN